jgi:hypothetical protein
LLYGDILYVSGGNGLRLLDTRIPNQPQTLGEVIDTKVLANSAGSALAVSGTSLFVAGGNGLAVFDIKTPTHPIKIHTNPNTGVLGNCGGADMVILGNLLYLVGDNGFAIFEISDPANPNCLSSGETGVLQRAGNASIAIDERRKIAVILGGKGMAIFDISDPTTQRKVWSGTTGAVGWAGDVSKGGGPGGGTVRLQGNHAFVIGSKGFACFDISDTSSPSKLGQIDTKTTSIDGGASMILSGSTAMIAGGYGVCLVDISNPSAMTKLTSTFDTGAIHLSDFTYLTRGSGDIVYVGGGKGLAVIDISNTSFVQVEKPAPEDSSQPADTSAYGDASAPPA